MADSQFDIHTAVPWGRSFSEYNRMFSLSESDLNGRILDCGGGPASFNAEATKRKVSVVSVDPIYAFDGPQIEQRVLETYPKVMDGVHRAHDRFVWTEIRSPEHLGEIRMAAMRTFLDDYDADKAEERYIAAELPALPFTHNSFDLALVSHLLFLYSEDMDLPFHIASIRELLRVAAEVRIFPLLAMDGLPSEHLTGVVDAMKAQNHSCEIRPVNYEFQRHGNKMLVVRR